MKSLIIVLAAWCLIISCHTEGTTGITMNEATETDSILQVIKNETTYFFQGDYNGWAGTWAHDEYTMQAWNNDDSTYSSANGWEAINKQGKEWIEKYYANGKNIIHPDVKREKPAIKFFNNTAWLVWKQYNANADKTKYAVSQETRMMEKKADGWKIVTVISLWDYKNKIATDSLPAGLQ